MRLRTLAFRNLRFHLRSHLGVLIGAAIGCAVLTGALIVGDSMRESLRERAIGKFGWIHLAVPPSDRLYSWSPHSTSVDPQTGLPISATELFGALTVPGTASRQNSTTRANNIQVYGMPCYWQEKPDGTFPLIAPNSVLINAALARQLGVQAGDEILLRCRKPSALSREIAITPHNEQTVALRLKVAEVTSTGTVGDFSIRSEQTPPMNAFVRLDELGSSLGEVGKVNMFVAGLHPGPWRTGLGKAGMFHGIESRLSREHPHFANWLGLGPTNRPAFLSTQESLKFENDFIRRLASLNFLGITVRRVPEQVMAELRSSQIFLEPELVRATREIAPDASGRCEILTLLANLIQNGTNITPYSIVTAAASPFTPPGIKDDEIVLNQWLADDLHAAPGTQIAVSYFNPESGAALRERTNVFRVRSIVPMELPWADRTLMPAFPGIENAQSTSDWDGGFPLTYKIRPKDEDYWKKFRGTPKAFITLAAGQKMWANRFGNLTAIRFIPPSTDNFHLEQLGFQIFDRLNLDAFGLRFQPVREQALKGAEQAQDFGQLFIGFSLFLVVAALLLMALLFQFGLERRASEIGILLALGFIPKKVRRLLLLEGSALAFVGSLLGAAAAVFYAKAMLHGLSTIWRSAVGGVTLRLHANTDTLAIGIASSVLVALVAMWLTLRKQGRQPARELLTGHAGQEAFGRNQAKLAWPFWVSVFAALAGLGTIAWAFVSGNRSDAEAFFSAACFLLISGLCALAACLRMLSQPRSAPVPGRGNVRLPPALHLPALAIRSCARRRKRSIATAALFATGVFLIIAIGVFRLDATTAAAKPSSGTGGFALIGQSTLPIVQDLNTEVGRDAFALNAESLRNTRIVQFRVHDGDEASCLNLDRPHRPRILGINPDSLKGRFTFATKDNGLGWNLLTTSEVQISKFDSSSSSALRTPHSALPPVPCLADANSLEWALHKKVGNTIDYTDDRGHSFQLRIVGAIANSILQGSLIIDETEFTRLFPGDTGYRMFLIDAPSNDVPQVSERLTRALQDVGLELTPTIQRLNAFNAVQNTYLGTFQILGGLGLLLGSAGLAIVVLRNMLERRGELGLLTAIGFTRGTLTRMTLIEHLALLVAGLGIGIIGAIIAVLPAITTPGRSLPYLSLALTIVAVIANGIFWTWLSTTFALRGNLLKALRNE